MSHPNLQGVFKKRGICALSFQTPVSLFPTFSRVNMLTFEIEVDLSFGVSHEGTPPPA